MSGQAERVGIPVGSFQGRVPLQPMPRDDASAATITRIFQDFILLMDDRAIYVYMYICMSINISELEILGFLDSGNFCKNFRCQAVRTMVRARLPISSTAMHHRRTQTSDKRVREAHCNPKAGPGNGPTGHLKRHVRRQVRDAAGTGSQETGCRRPVCQEKGPVRQALCPARPDQAHSGMQTFTHSLTFTHSPRAT